MLYIVLCCRIRLDKDCDILHVLYVRKNWCSLYVERDRRLRTQCREEDCSADCPMVSQLYTWERLMASRSCQQALSANCAESKICVS